MNDAVSFTIPIRSTVDNNMDAIFYVHFAFINGLCHNPHLDVAFEEIDFAQPTEFIEIYYPSEQDYLGRCRGNRDQNCGYFVDCLQNYALNANATDSLTITLLKSSEVNQFCDYSMNANVTIHCGPPAPTQTPTSTPSMFPTPSPTPDQLAMAFEDTFDLELADKEKLFNEYMINVHSSFDNNVEVIFNVTFNFLHGVCSNPYLSVQFEEIDHAEHSEYLEIRYPTDSEYDAIGRCDGNEDANCGNWEHCLSFYDLAVFNVTNIENSLTFYVLKSAEVNAFCHNSINANLTISCFNAMKWNQNMVNVTCPPSPECTPSPSSAPSTALPTTSPTLTTPPTKYPTKEPTGHPTKSAEQVTSTSNPTVTNTSIDCGGTATAHSDDGNKEDKLMDYLPWILLAVSGFFNILLLLALTQQIRSRKSMELRQRMNLMQDSTQMVTMHSRAGHDDQGSFQEITSDASVDYVTLEHA